MSGSALVSLGVPQSPQLLFLTIILSPSHDGPSQYLLVACIPTPTPAQAPGLDSGLSGEASAPGKFSEALRLQNLLERQALGC